ncbi:MAG: ABC transporter ATP-binding protein [Pseudomonadota bacterium]
MSRVAGAHIDIANVSHGYRGASTQALSDISITIEPGQAVALIGRSGCGKSTLLHIIAGLMTPSSGQVVCDGRTVSGPDASRVMMFQQPSLFPWMTVSQNIALGLRFNGRMAEAPDRITELLDLVELTSFHDRNVQDLSGGQQQRVALARSLALRPDALLLDEPFSSLDAFTRASLQRDVRRIAREQGLTLILVTHDVNEAALMADRAVLMRSDPGRIVSTLDLAGTAASHDPDTRFKMNRDALIAAYETAAGLSMGAGLSTGHDAQSQTTPTRKDPNQNSDKALAS